MKHKTKRPVKIQKKKLVKRYMYTKAVLNLLICQFKYYFCLYTALLKQETLDL